MTSTPLAQGTVHTVCGTLDPGLLGRTLMHEHVLCDITPPGRFRDDEPDVEIALDNVWEIRHHWCAHPGNNRLDREDVAIRELVRFKKTGGMTLVDVTTEGIKRNPTGLKRVAQASGIQIVMGCGFYTQDYLSPETVGKTVESLAEEILSDLREGVGGTGIRAGIIGEIGCSSPWTEVEKKVLRAAALAQQETGAAVTVHPGRSSASPFEIVTFFVENGGDSSRFIIGHIDRTLFDTDSILRLADTGCVLEFDFFGIESSFYPFQEIDLPNDGMRLLQVWKLIEAGHLSQVLLSQDICTKTRLVEFGGHGYGHLFQNVVPMMLRKGFSREAIDTIFVETPRRLLTLPAKSEPNDGEKESSFSFSRI